MSKWQKRIKQKLNPVSKCKIAYKKEEHYKDDKPDTTKYKAVRLFSELAVPDELKIYCPVCGSLTQKWIGNRGMVDICWNCRKVKKE